MKSIDVLIHNMSKAIIGKENVTKKIIICVLCNGHILLEDVPGVGKTTMVYSLAKSLDMSFNRIQFTPDLLPSDVTGISIYNQKNGEFEFKSGPIFNNIILADEINRTSPKTQSSLLEAMQEGKVTVDGNTYLLPRPFIVLATQNPIEYEGTFPLPEAQLDRFMMRLSIGYPDRMSEKMIIRRYKGENLLNYIKSVLTVEDILEMQEEIENIYVDESIENYIIDIITRTRGDENIALGVSPRGSISLYKAAKGLAYINNRKYVIPDDVKEMTIPVLSHRIIMKAESRIRAVDEVSVLNNILARAPVPMVKRDE
ncbi:AAA family ATPase [Brassicibacter mesophilus]|uniref:AAA family ATPase n=1 Tax=Brassicibacter mesophilus TaxID=745119 RepID=UPI003D1F5C64